jgi:hypothetical protein
MRARTVRVTSAGALALLLVVCSVPTGALGYQSGDPSGEYKGKKTQPAKKPKEEPKQSQPRRVSRKTALQWRLVKREKDGTTADADPNAPFFAGDDLRLIARVEQDGFLYVVHQEEGKKPYLLFPDVRINNGQNRVTAGVEYNVPAYCPEDKNAESCWQRLTRQRGRGLLVVVFAREPVPVLMDELVQQGPLQLDQAAVGRVVDASGKLLMSASPRDVQTKSVGTPGAFTKRVVNGSSERRIVDTLTLKVEEPPRPLAIQWRLMKREKDQTVREADPAATFMAGDELRFVCKAEKDGFLYVIHQEEGKKPYLLFPDTRINNGQNRVAAGEEYNVPAYCTDDKSAENCWRRLARSPGRGLLVVVFSLERNPELVTKILQNGSIRVDDVAGGRMLDDSGQTIVRVAARSPLKEGTAGVFVAKAGPDPSAKLVVETLALKVAEAPRPLALQWRLMQREKDKTEHETDPGMAYLTGDELRLVCKAEKDGYLYVVHQEEGGKPYLLFPDSRINNGQNRVAAGEEYNVPAYCPPDERNPANCWRQITKKAGRGLLIVVFSREKNPAVLDKILKGPIQIDAVATGQVVDSSALVLGLLSPRRPIKASGSSGFVVEASGPGSDSGEQLIDTIVLNVANRGRWRR